MTAKLISWRHVDILNEFNYSKQENSVIDRVDRIVSLVLILVNYLGPVAPTKHLGSRTVYIIHA